MSLPDVRLRRRMLVQTRPRSVRARIATPGDAMPAIPCMQPDDPMLREHHRGERGDMGNQ
ncbi:MAG TPA: hypothetical protein VFK54_07700 [Candidatus Limnocylindrales bacterium]|nr:hypothetical protein [Candidatus Limnocylindrales bacterium]